MADTSAYTRLLHTDDELVVVLSLDQEILGVSDTVVALTGLAAEDLVGRQDWYALLHRREALSLRTLWSQLHRSGRLRTTLRVDGPAGVPVWLDVTAKILEPSTSTSDRVVYVSARDVTDDVLATAHLAASEGQWRVAFERSPIGGVLVDVTGDVLLANDAASQMLGEPVEHLVRRSWFSLVHPEHRERERARWQELADGTSRTVTSESRYLRADGATIWASLNASVVNDDELRPHRVMAQLVDVTERREAELALANRTLHDPLTGLPNRFLTRQWLASALAESGTGGVGVLYCGLDRFKLVNDSLGSTAGDELLVEAAARIRETVAPDDLIGRVGGDEFVVVCEGAGGSDRLFALAGRIAAALDDPIRTGAHHHTVTVSIGMAIGHDPIDADELLIRADLALHRAKRHGRARVELFDPAFDHVATAADLELEDELRGSVDSRELRAYYQPIVTLADRRVVGHESLVRWQHRHRGLLPPAGFLDLAETSGLIRPIGWWMLRQACRDAATAPELLPDRQAWIAVNASPNQLARPGVLDRVRTALALSSLPPSRLHLEITETALIHASSSLVSELTELRELGVHVVLDDFGTGYSSLSLLRRLPVDMVKIDRSFVAPLATDRSALAIVRAVLSMCHDMDLPTVAEGVEDEEQVRMLTDLGCSHAQGFLFGRPEPLTPADTRVLALGPAGTAA